jgi:hypothetical protein
VSVTYLTTLIAAAKYAPPANPRAGMARDGYTLRRGAPTRVMIQLSGEKRWRRVMVWQFSNAGTCFVRIKGVPHVVRDLDIPTPF